MIVREWGVATTRGKVRETNEDSLLADPPLFLVADGMGGHAAGDVASQLAINHFVGLVGQEGLSVGDAVAALLEANAAIVTAADLHPENAGMGTTIAGLAVVTAAGAEHWVVLNVGDSRVYRLVAGNLTQLTVDHSEAEEMVAAGQITRNQAREYFRRNIVTRSLGTEPPPVPDSWVFPPVPGERFLVCSDGLTNELPDSSIEFCLRTIDNPQAAALELVERAVASGGRDNITVIVVDGTPDDGRFGADEVTAPRGRHGG